MIINCYTIISSLNESYYPSPPEVHYSSEDRRQIWNFLPASIVSSCPPQWPQFPSARFLLMADVQEPAAKHQLDTWRKQKGEGRQKYLRKKLQGYKDCYMKDTLLPYMIFPFLNLTTAVFIYFFYEGYNNRGTPRIAHSGY